MPSIIWTRLTTIFPSSSTVDASARAITSYGPVTSSADTTPSIPSTSVATWAALPTSVWIRMYALTAIEPPRLLDARIVAIGHRQEIRVRARNQSHVNAHERLVHRV